MNAPLNLLDVMRFIFTIALLVASASLTEAIPNKNAHLIELRCPYTHAIRVASEARFVSYSKTLASGCDPFQSVRA